MEGNFAQAESGQFILNWEGSQVSDAFSRQILETLEQQYRELEVALNFSPRDPIVVIIYAAQQFSDVTQAPGWAGVMSTAGGIVFGGAADGNIFALDARFRPMVRPLNPVTAEWPPGQFPG